MARRSSRSSRIPPASPASTRLQYRASKYSGCLRNAADRLVPVSTSVRMSLSSRVSFGLVLPRPTMSNDCSSGTPALHHGRELAREDRDVLLLDRLAAAHAALLHLVDHHALAAQARAHHGLAAGAHLAAHDLAVLVLAFPLEDDFLDPTLCSYRCRCHTSSRTEPRLSLLVCYSLVTEITSSSVVTPDRTLIRPDWRRSRTPSRCACAAMSIALPVAEDDLLDLLGDRHDLVDADAALVAVVAR